MRGKIFQALVVMITAAILWLLPVTEAVDAFLTDVKTDTRTVVTAVGVTTANFTLVKAIYNADTSSLSLSSSDYTDAPILTSYNGTSRLIVLGGLSGNTTRTITASYDIDALSNSAGVASFLSNVDMIWLLSILAFAPAALAAIFTGRA